MPNPLLERLQAKTKKKGTFSSTQSPVAYESGFPTLDYRNGCIVESRDENEVVIGERASVGIVGGSFITTVGKSGVAKTTLMIQIGANIVKKFKNGMFVIFDLEQSLTMTRIKNITSLSQKELMDKVVLRQEKNYIEDIFTAIMDIANEKENNREDYIYKTGLLDEFGREIEAFEPTVILVDSIPTLSVKETDGNTEMEGQTYANRVARTIAQFYKKLMPIIRTYNITVMAINHINAKIDINPMAKSQAQLQYMKQDEAMPGGNSPIYYAHNIFKLVSAGKFKKEDDGFDGSKVRVELLKSRTNKAGQFVNLVFNQEIGFDPLLSMIEYCSDYNLLDGRNPYKYFVCSPDVKFDSRKFREEFMERAEVRDAMAKTVFPSLASTLSKVNLEEESERKMTMDELLEVGAQILS